MSINHGARTAAGGRITLALGGLLVHLRFRNSLADPPYMFLSVSREAVRRFLER